MKPGKETAIYTQGYKDGYNDGENAYIDPDYWTRLEHQYVGMAMQAYIIISQSSFCEGDMKDCKSIAHALVQELKEKEERE